MHVNITRLTRRCWDAQKLCREKLELLSREHLDEGREQPIILSFFVTAADRDVSFSAEDPTGGTRADTPRIHQLLFAVTPHEDERHMISASDIMLEPFAHSEKARQPGLLNCKALCDVA